MRRVFLPLLVLTALGLLLFTFDRSADPDLTNNKPDKGLRRIAAPMEQEQFVSCRTPAAFSARTGIASIGASQHIGFESGFDENLKLLFEYPISVETSSARAFFKDGDTIALPDADAAGAVDPTDHKSLCRNYGFLTLGTIAIITEFLGTGNPYPIERHWAIDIERRELVDLRDLIEHLANVEQATPDCVRNMERGSAAEPGRQDLWCASGASPRPRLVQQLMTLDRAASVAIDPSVATDGRNDYWFRCDRASGTGMVSEPMHSVHLGQQVLASDPRILSLMQARCDEWAAKKPENTGERP